MDLIRQFCQDQNITIPEDKVPALAYDLTLVQ